MVVEEIAWMQKYIRGIDWKSERPKEKKEEEKEKKEKAKVKFVGA